MKRPYALVFFVVFTIPVFLGVNAWQANDVGALRNEIRRLERVQENLLEENRTVAAEIAHLLAVNRLEDDAINRLGMTRMRPEDVTLIIVGGEESGH